MSDIFKYIFYLLLCCIFLLNNTTYANNNQRDRDTSKLKIGILPSVYYTTETKLAVGLFGHTNFRTTKKDSNHIRRSNTQTYFNLTTRRQLILENDYQIWLSKNKIYLTGKADFFKFGEYFFGIGNTTKPRGADFVRFDLLRIQLKNLYNVNDKFYFGVYYQFQDLFGLRTPIINKKTNEMVRGGYGYDASGIGPILIYDNRNNSLNPSKGSYFETSYQSFSKFTFSNFKFNTLIVDYRRFFTIKNKYIWNGNVYFVHNNGEVPFRMMAEIGGSRIMRGYFKGRFRDNNMIVLQHEIRFPVYKAFGLAFFNGIGQVASTIDEFDYRKFHSNFGIGLRIKLRKNEDTNLRFDYGITRDMRGLYIVYAEAF